MLDRKPNTYHHCDILGKDDILNCENLTKYTDACLMFKNLNGKAPPPHSIFIKQKNLNNRSTRLILGPPLLANHAFSSSYGKAWLAKRGGPKINLVDLLFKFFCLIKILCGGGAFPFRFLNIRQASVYFVRSAKHQQNNTITSMQAHKATTHNNLQ